MKVLIIRPGALGDTLMVLPALADLAGRALITFVGRRPGLDFVRAYAGRCLDLETPGWHRLFAETPERASLPVSGTDLVIAFFTDKSTKACH